MRRKCRTLSTVKNIQTPVEDQKSVLKIAKAIAGPMLFYN